MPFQPLGYPFEVRSPMSQTAVKAALRAKKKGWFSVENGARGWIIGPIMCLWFSAFDSHGPMVIAHIQGDGLGTRITGRAGADLNGTLLFLLLTPLTIFLLGAAIGDGAATMGMIIPFAIVFGFGLPLTLWINSKDRRDADPLVTFVRRAVRPASRQHSIGERGAPAAVSVEVNGVVRDEPVSGAELSDLLAGLGTLEHLILSRDEQTFMQVRNEGDSFRIEKREGSEDRHFAADLPKMDVEAGFGEDPSLLRITERMADYLYGREPVSDLKWKRISV